LRSSKYQKWKKEPLTKLAQRRLGDSCGDQRIPSCDLLTVESREMAVTTR
jgi:hypothetical protein